MTEVDFDTRKYRRSAFIPDYRETMFSDEPQYTNEIPFAPSTTASVRHSVWSAEPQKDLYSPVNGYSTTTSRRNSIAPIFAKKAAAEASDTASSVWRYSSSPSKTDLTLANGQSNGATNGTAARRKSTAPIFAQKAAAAAVAGAAENGSAERRNSQSPGPVLKSKSGLVYGNSNWHNADAPVLSPTAETDSIASFKTARENGVTASRRYSDGAGLTDKRSFYNYAVQEPMPQKQPNGTAVADTRVSRRYSDLSALNGAGHNSPRNVSPVDSRRSVALGQVSRSGAVSPIGFQRSNSPLGNRPRNGTTATAASGIVSPVSLRNGGFSGATSIRSGSPSGQITSPLARNSMMAAPPSSGAGTTAPKTKASAQKLSLNTQVAGQQAPPASKAAETKKSPTPSEAEEEMDEVIALSPAGRAPIQNFRRSRSSLLLSGNDASATTQSLNSLMSAGGGSKREEENRYFGQDVNMDDLVANNLENAFDRL